MPAVVLISPVIPSFFLSKGVNFTSAEGFGLQQDEFLHSCKLLIMGFIRILFFSD
jgi:hypothetical protein